jgi:hypothetical protein
VDTVLPLIEFSSRSPQEGRIEFPFFSFFFYTQKTLMCERFGMGIFLLLLFASGVFWAFFSPLFFQTMLDWTVHRLQT